MVAGDSLIEVGIGKRISGGIKGFANRYKRPKKTTQAEDKTPEWDNSSARTDGEAGNAGIDGRTRHSLSNDDVRDWYHAQEDRIPSLIDDNAPLEIQARQAHELRNRFRADARELMSDRAAAERLYRDRPNSTWNEQVERARRDIRKRSNIQNPTNDDIHRHIIGNSTKSDPTIDTQFGTNGPRNIPDND